MEIAAHSTLRLGLCVPRGRTHAHGHPGGADNLKAGLCLDSVLWSGWIVLPGGLGARAGGTAEILILFSVAFLVGLSLRVCLIKHRVEPASDFHVGIVFIFLGLFVAARSECTHTILAYSGSQCLAVIAGLLHLFPSSAICRRLPGWLLGSCECLGFWPVWEAWDPMGEERGRESRNKARAGYEKAD